MSQSGMFESKYVELKVYSMAHSAKALVASWREKQACNELISSRRKRIIDISEWL